jgi:hypothetical protein
MRRLTWIVTALADLGALAVTVRAAIGVKSANDLIKLARARPDTLLRPIGRRQRAASVEGCCR